MDSGCNVPQILPIDYGPESGQDALGNSAAGSLRLMVDISTFTINIGLCGTVITQPDDAIEFILSTPVCVNRDTDLDGTPDFMDIDSDNDGCNDVDEAYNNKNTDSDNDGKFGAGTPTVDTNGLVTAAGTVGSFYVTSPATIAGGQNTFQQGIQVNINTPPTDQSTCQDTTANFSAIATATRLLTNPVTTASTNLSFQWQMSTNGGATFNNIPGESGTIASGATTTLSITNVTLAMSGNIFKVLFTNEANICGEEAQATLTVDQQPVASDQPNQNLCNTSTFTMTQTTPIAGTGVWTLVSGTATITDPTSPTTTITGVSVGNTATVRWTVSNGTCAVAFDDVSVTNEGLLIVSDQPNQSLCDTSTFTMTQTTPIVGTGVWTLVSGAPSVTITDPNSPTTTVTGVSIDTSATLEWTVTNGAGVCASASDQVILTNNSQSVVSDQPNQNLCNTSTFTMTQTTPIAGTGVWTLVSGTATITDPTSPTTTITGVSAGNTATVRWTVSNGTCAVAFDDVSVTNEGLLIVSDQPNQSLCDTSTFTMTQTAPIVGTGVWTLVSGAPSVTITDPNSPTTTVTGVSIDTSATLEWTITNGAGVCASASDQVILTNNSQSVVSDQPNQNLCNTSTFTMTQTTPIAGTGVWTLVSGTATITDPTSPTTTITGVSVGNTATVRWTVSNGTCTDAVDQVTITNINTPTIAVDGAPVNPTTCGDTDGSIKLIFTNVADGDHIINHSGGTFGTITVTGGSATITGLASGTYNDISIAILGCTSTDDVDLTLTCVNANSTIAITDFNDTYKNTSVTGNVLTNDFDLEGDTQTVTTTTVTTTQGVTVTIDSNGNYTYTPPTDYIGADSFEYTVCDNGTPQACDTATVYLEVLVKDKDTDKPPVANPDTNTTVMNVPVDGNLLVNDFNLGDGPLTVTIAPIVDPTNGTVVINPDGTYTYTPNPGFVGEDTFEYQICNAEALCDTATVTITVLNNNIQNITVANDDAYTTEVSTVVTGTVTTNDFDPEGHNQVVTTTISQEPSNGTVTINANGDFTYTPNDGYVGPDHFVYQICDDGVPSACDKATVYITVTPINTTYAITDINNTFKNTSVTGNVLTNDFDLEGDTQVVTTTSVTTEQGVVVTIDPTTGEYTYTPPTDFIGTDSFEYTVCDNGTPQACDTATVYLEVFTEVNETKKPPIANADTNVTLMNIPVDGNLLVNDFNLGDGPLSVTTTPTKNPIMGTVVINPDGTYTYTPNPGFVGQDTFEYQICNDDGLCDTAIVTITVLNNNNENDTVANDDAYTSEVNTAITGTVTTNDFDPQGDSITTSIIKETSNGTVTISANGDFTYTPNDGYIGTDQFVYQVCDNGTPQACDKATVYITVTQPDAPCLTIYNEFSPNGDGVNDTFVIDCIENYPDNKTEVYNRWGNKVYEKSGYLNDWDGTSNGRALVKQADKLPVGTYYYVLDLGDGSKPRAGWLYINR